MDLIDREQAIATIDNLNAVSFYEANEHSREAYKEMRTAIKQLPSARPKGKWIRITQGADPEKYMCPFCHRTVYDYGPDCMVSIRYPYCHCGADMREVE